MFVGAGVGTADGILVGKVVNGQAVDGGDGGVDVDVVGDSFVGTTEGLPVCVSVGTGGGMGLGVRGGDIFERGVGGRIDGDGVGVGDDGPGVVDGIILGHSVVCESVGDGAETADGKVLGGLVMGSVIGERDGSMNGANVGISIV